MPVSLIMAAPLLQKKQISYSKNQKTKSQHRTESLNQELIADFATELTEIMEKKQRA